ncbi:MAG: glycine cleavage system protein GcvH [Saprospiraceae bacterium]|nr:glycine cleavage system protein GcvH [Saprospiraceae bacterium]|tara:strand:+ start:2133 stop:2522 length:390 start_codon:yes stop_codon:yes gene_type:complete
MNVPEGLKYSSEHEWIKIDDKIATIGVTDHAQSELGDIVYVEVDTVDEDIIKDKVFGSVEAVKTTSDLFMPISGKVIEFNEKISEDGDDNPALINEDPYGGGWIIKIEIQDMEEIETLLSADEYKNLIG